MYDDVRLLRGDAGITRLATLLESVSRARCVDRSRLIDGIKQR
jgi:hypothetical protein